MSENPPEEHIVIVGPDGQPVGTVPSSAVAAAQQQVGTPGGDDDDERHITELVEQPAKVMRIGSMIRQLLEEVKAAPLDDASRKRLKEIHQASIHELEAGLAPELVEELDRLTLPFSEDQTPSEGERHITELVEQPAKVMRIGSMIRQLLEEVKSAPLDQASRSRLREIHQSSIAELEKGLAPELIEELERLSLPLTEEAPSESELRIAQAQLVGWLEGLFHGIQTALFAQQMAARVQLEQMRGGQPALPPGQIPPSPNASTGQYL